MDEGWGASMVSTDGSIHRSAPGSIPGRSSRNGIKPLRSRYRCGIVGNVSGRRHIETREAPQ
jgi:hypothetical protein